MSKKIAVIDGNSLMHRAYHAVQTPMTAKDGTPTNAVFGFLTMLCKFIEMASPDAVVCAFDAGKPVHRIEAMAQYKAQRPPMDEELHVQFPVIQELLESMAIPVVKVPGWEGDDILGTIAARDEALGYETLLVTGDKDAYQLASDKTRIVTTKKGITDVAIYGPAEVDRLQQVLLYREAEMPLADIKRLLDDPAFDARDALVGHLRELHARKERLDGLIASVEKTLASLEGDGPMKDEEKFEAFKQGLVDENEKKYGKEVRERWGDDAADASNAKLMGMSVEQYRQTQKLEQGVKDALAAAMAAGDPTGEDAHRAADLHRQWLCEFWKDGTYSKAAHLGLAEMYVADDRFKAYYEAVAPGAAEFLRDAIKAYCA